MPPEIFPKVLAIFLLVLGIIFILSFFGQAGPGGQWLAQSFYFLIGKAVYALPFILFLTGFCLLKTDYRHYLISSSLAVIFLLISIAGILTIKDFNQRAGGFIGYLVGWPIFKLFGFWVTNLIFIALSLVSLLVFWQLIKEKTKKIQRVEEKVSKPEIIVKKEKEEEPKKGLLEKLRPKREVKKEPEKPSLIPQEPRKLPARIMGFTPYPLELLGEEEGKPDSGDINRNKEIIRATLGNFDIPVTMDEANVGPTVTQYTLKPAEGIKLSKITALSQNLSLALAAHPLRIEAPIPGEARVGIEVPNKTRVKVRLRNLLQSPDFQKSDSLLTFALGKGVAGTPLFADLSRMPHLLVAGATGTGKTIFLNSLILSLLQKNSPQTLRFILIDPKRVEFPIYQDLPHLLGSIIFETERTILTLKWLISEMENRFRTLASAGTRDIRVFNEIQLKSQKKEMTSSEIMPYIVVIIDELADLMAAKGREMEAGIVRLAQMARAVGIHLVLATQRPSVEVLTGLIKANITSRVAFQVATQVDSRTILDMAGAEKLLGLGDMLFLSPASPKPKRIQAAYVEEKEVRRVVDWLRTHQEYSPYNYLLNSLEAAIYAKKEEELIGKEIVGKPDDELYEKAKDIVIEAKKASASLLQRRLKIGYARAARLLDLLEERGIIGPPEGAKPRRVFGEISNRTFEEFDKNRDNYRT